LDGCFGGVNVGKKVELWVANKIRHVSLFQNDTFLCFFSFVFFLFDFFLSPGPPRRVEKNGASKRVSIKRHNENWLL
jgi:hypothetical protein